MRKELDLTPAQAEQMEVLLNDFWQLYHTVLSDSKQRVEQILNEEQRKKFEILLSSNNPASSFIPGDNSRPSVKSRTLVTWAQKNIWRHRNHPFGRDRTFSRRPSSDWPRRNRVVDT